MKRFRLLLCILLCAAVLCGCEKMIIKEQVMLPPETEENSSVTEMTDPKDAEIVEFYAYDLTIISSKLAVYSGPGYNYETMGYITDRGTYTIIAEEVEKLSAGKATIWGKLSTDGWINLEDAMEEPKIQEETVETTEETKAEFQPYVFKLVHHCVLIYSGPGYTYDGRGEITDKGSYTIVEESEQTFTGGRSVTWGKLKSGAGWICLDDAKLKTDGGPPYRCTECGRADVYISRDALCEACHDKNNAAEYGTCAVCGEPISLTDVAAFGTYMCYACYQEEYCCSICGKDCFETGTIEGMCRRCYDEVSDSLENMLDDLLG